MADTNINKQAEMINRKIREMSALYRCAAQESGVSDGEVDIWTTLLNSDEAYTQQDFCDMLSLPKQTVNSIVRGLVRKGYVTLEHVPGTRNRKVIRLTPMGREFGLENVQWIYEAEQRAIQDGDAQEVQTTLAMLEKYIERLRHEFER